MIKNRLEDLWNSADDGASAPVNPQGSRPLDEYDQLLDAWYVERHYSIEYGILLDESRKMIERLIAEGGVSSATRRRARRLMDAITETLRTAEAEGS